MVAQIISIHRAIREVNGARQGLRNTCWTGYVIRKEEIRFSDGNMNYVCEQRVRNN